MTGNICNTSWQCSYRVHGDKATKGRARAQPWRSTLKKPSQVYSATAHDHKNQRKADKDQGEAGQAVEGDARTTATTVMHVSYDSVMTVMPTTQLMSVYINP